MSYDLVVIGTGPGGYVCAIRAAQLGMKVAVVEKRATHGGTCLNVGCIPSKALLHASELYEDARDNFKSMGIELNAPQLNLRAMMQHKKDVVQSNVSGIDYLLKKNKIDVFTGVGTLQSKGHINVTAQDGTITPVETKNVVIATGSEPISLPGITIDEKRIVSSTGALELNKVPEHLVVVGAGVIGLELGSVWARLGAKVTVVEFLDRILPGIDTDVAKQFQRILKKQGLDFKLGTKVTGVVKGIRGVTIQTEASNGGQEAQINADVLLVAIGRRPYTAGLGLEGTPVIRDKAGRIEVDAHFKTGLEGVYAIGDVIKGPMLAHKAEEDGVAVAEMLAGQAGHVDYDLVPSVIYTMPEVATIGQSEDQLKEQGIAYSLGKFPFSANGRAKAIHAADGFVKILADADTDKVLGAQIVGPNAGEMIHEVAVLMGFGGSAEDLARICHAHPTLSEAVKEAALATDKRPIHI